MQVDGHVLADLRQLQPFMVHDDSTREFDCLQFTYVLIQVVTTNFTC
jgi:hypothetical protein